MISSVPVVVLFTKFDALLPVALGKLLPADRQLPLQERLSKAKSLVEGIFNGANVWGRLSYMIYPPRGCVRIEGMFFSYTLGKLSVPTHWMSDEQVGGKQTSTTTYANSISLHMSVCSGSCERLRVEENVLV